MLRSKLCSNSQGGLLFSCCIAYEDPPEHKIDRRLIGPPMDFRHLAHMGSGGSTSVTSSVISGIGLDDSSSSPAPFTTHLKLIDLSEALAVHNAAAAMRASCQQVETSPDPPSPPSSSVKTRGSNSSERERRKSAGTSRYLISGPLPPPPPPPPPSALIT